MQIILRFSALNFLHNRKVTLALSMFCRAFENVSTGELACRLTRKMEYADLERECEELIATNIPAAMPVFMNADGCGERLLITHIDVDNFKLLPRAYMLFPNA